MRASSRCVWVVAVVTGAVTACAPSETAQDGESAASPPRVSTSSESERPIVLQREPGYTWLEGHPAATCRAEDVVGALSLDPSGNLPHSQVELVRAYYQSYGVQVAEVKAVSLQEGYAVCLACGCPATYTVYLLVPVDQVGTLQQQGYQISDNVM